MTDDVIGDHGAEYEAASLEEINQWMTGGKGLGATDPATEGLGALVNGWSEHTDDMRNGMNQLGIAWSGAAASLALTRLRQAAEWAQQASQTSKTGQASVRNYGSSFAAMASRIPRSVPVPDMSVWDDVKSFFDIQTDQSVALARNQELHAEAVGMLTQHEGTTREVVGQYSDQHDPDAFTAATPTIPAGTTSARGLGPVSARSPASSGAPASPTPGTDGGKTGAGTRTEGNTGGTGGAPSSPPSGTAPSSDRTPPPVPSDPTGDIPSGRGASAGNGAGPVEREGGVGKMPPLPTGATSGYQPGRIAAARNPRNPTPQPIQRTITPAPAEPRPASGELTGTAAAAKPSSAGMGGMPMGATTGAGAQQREHRNNVFIPSDEPFVVNIDDEVVPAVLGLPQDAE